MNRRFFLRLMGLAPVVAAAGSPIVAANDSIPIIARGAVAMAVNNSTEIVQSFAVPPEFIGRLTSRRFRESELVQFSSVYRRRA